MARNGQLMVGYFNSMISEKVENKPCIIVYLLDYNLIFRKATSLFLWLKCVRCPSDDKNIVNNGTWDIEGPKSPAGSTSLCTGGSELSKKLPKHQQEGASKQHSSRVSTELSGCE